MYNKRINSESELYSWMDKVVNYVAKRHNINDNSDTKYWDRYFAKNVKDGRFDYLLKVGSFSLPTNDRHIPIQRK